MSVSKLLNDAIALSMYIMQTHCTPGQTCLTRAVHCLAWCINSSWSK